jgi:hypothetical protein
MRAIDGRVTRMERAYGLHRAPDGEAALRRCEEVVHLVPTAALRLLMETIDAGHPEVPLSPEHRAAEDGLSVLIETEAWPA